MKKMNVIKYEFVICLITSSIRLLYFILQNENVA